MQYFFRKQIGKGFFEEIFAFEAVKLETHRQTGHELGDVAIKERRPDFKGIQHGTAVYLDQDVIEQEFVCVDIEGPLQGRGILPVGKVAESGSKEELFLKESLIRMTEKFFWMQVRLRQRLPRQKLRLNLKSIESFRTDCLCLTLINTCWNWKRMRRNNRIVSPFQCRIFRHDKVECMEN